MSQESTLSIDSPQAQRVNVIELVSCTNSSIAGVSVYSSRAEIKRCFTLNIKEGRNRVSISGLPKVLIRDSVRAELNDGAATIHDVTVTFDPPAQRSTSGEPSNIMKGLLGKKERAEKACERAKKSLPPLETYLKLLKIDTSNLSEAVESYSKVAKELDDTIARLETELTETNKAIKEEKKKENLADEDPKLKKFILLQTKALIGVVGHSNGEIKIALIYAVDSAAWNAEYDIHVDTQTKENPSVILTYKATITQDTGEDWNNVPLSLQTVKPTFSLDFPTLNPLNIFVHRQSQGVKRSSQFSSDSSEVMLRQARLSPIRIGGNESSIQSLTQERRLGVPKSNYGASFEPGGLISIPSGPSSIIHNVYNVVITEICLDDHAMISRVCVPKKDTKTYLKAKIKNTSNFNFLSGKANVYVDGVFISKSNVPFVATEESFDCILPVDPSIRVTYHPRSKKVSSRFFSRTTTYLFSQRITVSNTSTSKIENLKIIDHVHTNVFEDSEITVKLVKPALKLPGEGLSKVVGELKPLVPPNAEVAQGIIAKWYGSGEVQVEALGVDGRLYWECTIPAQTKIGLVLEWKVKVPLRTDIVGLKF